MKITFSQLIIECAYRYIVEIFTLELTSLMQ